MTNSLRRGPTGTFGLSAEAAQVVAWHNRHPLAVRIRPDHVQGMGWVLFPFSGQGGHGPVPGDADLPDINGTGAGDGEAKISLRERAMQRSEHGDPSHDEMVAPSVDRKALKAAFSELVLPGIKLLALTEFAHTHGDSRTLPVGAKPRREARLDASLTRGEAAPLWLHLPTASIELGSRRSRVLLGAAGQVLGRRLLSRVRLALVAGLPLLLMATGVAVRFPQALGLGSAQPTQASVSAPDKLGAAAVAKVAVPAASAASAASAPAVGHVFNAATAAGAQAPQGGAVNGAASGAMAAASPLPSSTATTQVQSDRPASAPHAVAVATAPAAPMTEGLKSIRPTLDPELARVARRESVALRAASAGVLSPTAQATQTAPSVPVTPTLAAAATDVSKAAGTKPSSRAQAEPASPRGAVFALVARTTRSRAASEILLAAMATEATQAKGAPRVEVLPSDGGFRASLWPFPTREAAELAQRRLQAGGLTTQLVEF